MWNKATFYKIKNNLGLDPLDLEAEQMILYWPPEGGRL